MIEFEQDAFLTNQFFNESYSHQKFFKITLSIILGRIIWRFFILPFVTDKQEPLDSCEGSFLYIDLFTDATLYQITHLKLFCNQNT